jgi:hypothetical protein
MTTHRAVRLRPLGHLSQNCNRLNKKDLSFASEWTLNGVACSTEVISRAGYDYLLNNNFGT